MLNAATGKGEESDDQDFEFDASSESTEFDSDEDSLTDDLSTDTPSKDIFSQLGTDEAQTLRQMLGQFQKTKSQSEQKLVDRYSNSVVEVTAQHRQYDFDMPYAPPIRIGSRGSGFIVNYQGQPCLVTNAHCAADVALLEVRLASSDKKVSATVKVIDHDCDLALLAVDDASFWDAVKPLELGDMPEHRANLSVYGFPMGGEGFCITEGGISRVETNDYAESGISLLTAQVDAAINPGNSGGPAIQDGKVLGVAFQGSNAGSMIGYIIPPPVVKHFLNNALAPGEYKGFPDLAVQCQSLSDDLLRKQFGLKEDQTGIRIKHVARLSAARGRLREDDILLEVEGHPIKDDGMIDCDVGKRLNWKHLVSMKNLGESIHFKILRAGKEKEIEVTLTNRANTTYYAKQVYDKPPTYVINSGVIFMPLTDNFVDDAASFFSGVSLDLEKLTGQDKKKPGQEIVFIHSVLKHEKTKDLEAPSGSIVSEINGTKVLNLRHAMHLLNKHSGDVHTIKTLDKDVLMFRNLPKSEQIEILKAYGVPSSCSSDLRHRPKERLGCPEAPAVLTGFADSRRRSKKIRAGAGAGAGASASAEEDTRKHASKDSKQKKQKHKSH